MRFDGIGEAVKFLNEGTEHWRRGAVTRNVLRRNQWDSVFTVPPGNYIFHYHDSSIYSVFSVGSITDFIPVRDIWWDSIGYHAPVKQTGLISYEAEDFGN